MTEETPYSKREIDIIIRGQSDNFGKLFDILKDQNVTLKSIESNQTTTSLEVALIKDTIKDYADIKMTVSGLVNYRWWIVGAGATFILLGGTLVLLVSSKIDSKISTGINQAVDQRLSKVQVINNN